MLFPWTKLDKPAALPSEFFPNCEGEYTWEQWSRDNKAKYPVRFWWQETMPSKIRHYWHYISEFGYWVRTHTYNRYHILDVRCPTWGIEYKWGWCDSPELILAASFQVLKTFMEKEFPGHMDWDCDEHHSQAAKEMKELYDWWMTGRKKSWDDHWKRAESFERTLAVLRSKEYHDHLDEMHELEKKDDVMLERLFKVRHFMWT